MEILKAKVTKDNTLVASYKNENGDTVPIGELANESSVQG